MGLSTASKNLALDAITMSHLSAHTAYPGDTGVNEVAGGAYARKAATIAAAAAGARTGSGSPLVTFDVPAATTVKWVGAWTALSAGTYRGCAPLGADKTGVATVQSSDDTIRSDAHGLANGDQVVFFPAAGEALPTGIVEGTDYFVVGATADTFQISATSGGSAINLTTDGEMSWSNIKPTTDAAAYKIDVSSITFNLNG